MPTFHVRRTVGLGVLGALILMPPAASAASKPCSEQRGRDLAPAKTQRLFDRPKPGSTGHRYYACTLDRGRLRFLRTSRPGAKITVVQSRGAAMLVREQGSKRLTVHWLASGDRLVLRRSGRNASTAVTTASGETAALYGTTLVGYDFDWKAYVIAKGVSRLRRTSATGIAYRTAAGERRFSLLAPKLPCAKQSGRTERTTAEIRIFRQTYAAEVWSGNVDGTLVRTMACRLKGGPAQVLATDDADSGYSEGGGSGTQIFAVSGTKVGLRQQGCSSYCDVSYDEIKVHDVADGSRRVVWDLDKRPRGLAGTPGSTVVLSPAGHVAAVFDDEEDDAAQTQLVVLKAGATPRIVDTSTTASKIKQSSLKFTGTVLSWTKAGQPNSIDVAAP
ncbi:hypothetical protein [Paraconexibacter sp.]|uniref:hypothetical protein n=1 Tax=Paraconexibacter sp. TaxID=2949640 RepID=UPI0035669779